MFFSFNLVAMFIYSNVMGTEVIDIYAPKKSMKIKQKDIIRQPWMTPALIKSTNTKGKMYRKMCWKIQGLFGFCQFYKIQKYI